MKVFLGMALGFGFAAGTAHADVIAIPYYQNLGTVRRGESAFAHVQFLNSSSVAVSFFNVNCSGDFDVFSCFSNCSYLPAYGSCDVSVTFSPFQERGYLRTVFLNGYGDGQFVSALVEGSEAEPETRPAARD